MTISQQIQNLEKNLTKTIKEEVQRTEKRLLGQIDLKSIASEKRLLGQIDMKSLESESRLEKNLLTHIDEKFAESSSDLNKQLRFHEKIIIDAVENRFDEKQKELRNDILDFKDDVFTELKSNRQETIVNSGRITRLEKSFLTN